MIIQYTGNDKCYRANTVRGLRARISFIEEKKCEQRLKGSIDLGSGTVFRVSEEMGISDHLTCLLKNLYAGQEATVRTGHEQQTGSKSGKQHIKAVYCHPALFTYMQSAS